MRILRELRVVLGNSFVTMAINLLNYVSLMNLLSPYYCDAFYLLLLISLHTVNIFARQIFVLATVHYVIFAKFSFQTKGKVEK